MSSEKRKCQRRYVRTKLLKESGSTRGFKKAWDDYRRKEIENEDDSITVIRKTRRTKKRHYDNGRVMLKHMRALKELIVKNRNDNKNKQ